MEKSEHGRRLKTAMAQRGVSNQALADLVNVDVKTVGNWRAGATLPNDADREQLRRTFPGYDTPGDPVEIAVRQSDLTGFRQTKVIAYYQEQLHEQQREERSA